MSALSKNKFISILLAFSLASNAFAGTINEVCSVSGEIDYFPIGDERGTSVLTKKEINRDCNLTIETQGACKKWETKNTTFELRPSDYDTYRSENHESALGSIMAIMGAYNQLEHLWSGWHGYCETGTKTDFSWASDPMFWASLAMSTMMSGMEKGQFLADTEMAQSYNAFSASAGSGFNSMAAGTGMKVGANFGKCLVASGVDMAANMYNYFGGDSGDGDCDPIDEFCGGSGSLSNTQESDIMTLDQQQYDDLIAQHPEAADQIVILDEENGILSVRFKQPSETEGSEAMNQEEMKKLQQKIKDTQFLISTAVVTMKMAACVGTGGKTGTTSNQDTQSGDPSRFSTKDGISMALNAIPAQYLGPYGALIKAALAIVLEFATSFKSVDTCNDEEDASAAGTRHKKTQESLPYNLCKLTSTSCAEKDFFGSGCGLDAYDYCCYDQLLTRILVEQLKAQLGRDWKHCTGVSLRDLNYVSFRQCTDHDKTFGVDGAKATQNYNVDGELTNPYNPTESFQYQRKCIDLTEFKDYLSTTFNQDVDFSDFDNIFSDIKNQK